MPFELGTPSRNDFPAVIDLMLRALDHSSALVNAHSPHVIHDTHIDGAEAIVAKTVAQLDADPTVKWMKVTDSTTGEIVSVSKWNVYRDAKPPEFKLSGGYESEEREYAMEMLEAAVGPRMEVFRGNGLPIMTIGIMATAKEFWRRGAASLMMKEGNRIADEIGALCLVESSRAAQKLYENAGYKTLKAFTVKAKSDKFADRPRDEIFFLVRERQAKLGES